MRGKVAKQLRIAAKMLSQGERSPMMRIPRKKLILGEYEGKKVTFEIHQRMWGPGDKTIYKNLKKAYKNGV